MRFVELDGSPNDPNRARDMAGNVELMIGPPLLNKGDRIDVRFLAEGRYTGTVMQPLGGFRYLVQLGE